MTRTRKMNTADLPSRQQQLREQDELSKVSSSTKKTNASAHDVLKAPSYMKKAAKLKKGHRPVEPAIRDDPERNNPLKRRLEKRRQEEEAKRAMEKAAKEDPRAAVVVTQEDDDAIVKENETTDGLLSHASSIRLSPELERIPQTDRLQNQVSCELTLANNLAAESAPRSVEDPVRTYQDPAQYKGKPKLNYTESWPTISTSMEFTGRPDYSIFSGQHQPVEFASRKPKLDTPFKPKGRRHPHHSGGPLPEFPTLQNISFPGVPTQSSPFSSDPSAPSPRGNPVLQQQAAENGSSWLIRCDTSVEGSSDTEQDVDVEDAAVSPNPPADLKFARLRAADQVPSHLALVEQSKVLQEKIKSLTVDNDSPASVTSRNPSQSGAKTVMEPTHAQEENKEAPTKKAIEAQESDDDTEVLAMTSWTQENYKPKPIEGSQPVEAESRSDVESGASRTRAASTSSFSSNAAAESRLKTGEICDPHTALLNTYLSKSTVQLKLLNQRPEKPLAISKPPLDGSLERADASVEEMVDGRLIELPPSQKQPLKPSFRSMGQFLTAQRVGLSPLAFTSLIPETSKRFMLANSLQQGADLARSNVSVFPFLRLSSDPPTMYVQPCDGQSPAMRPVQLDSMIATPSDSCSSSTFKVEAKLPVDKAPCASKLMVGTVSLLDFLDEVFSTSPGTPVTRQTIATAFLKLSNQELADDGTGHALDDIDEVLRSKLLCKKVRIGNVTLHEFLAAVKFGETGLASLAAIWTAWKHCSEKDLSNYKGLGGLLVGAARFLTAGVRLM
ncbi:hypothetical protein K491DRAFT_322098 [Lophiostoma macrostomum CBS 122681]|uniref:Uncharacterized protein n=1 Tax=Lophiostoma macrostomum CBS 122681 TaxID=1314788 RepID=A0A6A6SI53_9PLEO|nr:hypothetical protein K491DRAFT_322098 [Lophiostoma macrostomum CBS 122681]